MPGIEPRVLCMPGMCCGPLNDLLIKRVFKLLPFHSVKTWPFYSISLKYHGYYGSFMLSGAVWQMAATWGDTQLSTGCPWLITCFLQHSEVDLALFLCLTGKCQKGVFLRPSQLGGTGFALQSWRLTFPLSSLDKKPHSPEHCVLRGWGVDSAGG